MLEDFFNIANYFVQSSIFALLALAVYEWFKLESLIKDEEKVGMEEMLKISSMIKEGSLAYLKRQFKVLIIVKLIIAVILTYLINIHVAITFILGAFLSWLCGFFAMYASVSSNYKVTICAKKGFNEAFDASFSVGKLVAFLVSGVAFLSVYLTYQYALFLDIQMFIKMLIGLSFGASLVSVFARIGGGIFTKGADISADLVGKIEKNIPEDDPRNPAVIADNVGDNVGDCAGMAADLFESYVVIVASAITLASYLFDANFISMLSDIFVILAIGAYSSIAVLLSGWKYENLYDFASLGIAIKMFVISCIFMVFGGYLFEIDTAIIACALIGVFSAAMTMPLTEYYTGTTFGPVQSIANACDKGAATNIIQGIAVGLEACFIPFIAIGISILSCIYVGGVFGVSIACLGMISVCTVILALDAFGPVTDNAGGLAEMGKLEDSIREITDRLDAIGNMTKATTKGYAVYSAALATLVLMTTYKMDLVEIFAEYVWIIDLTEGAVLAGIFFGAALVALFGSICMVAVNEASMAIIEEVRAQFKEKPGIMDGTQQPDYNKAIDMLTKASLKQMIVPSLLPLLGTVAFFEINNYFFGIQEAFVSLGGFIIGVTIIGIYTAISMTVSGGAWDNAKKLIESRGDKGTDLHQAAVIGDTVGDPYKDTVGPSMNPMVKLVAIVSILLIIIHS